LRDLEDRDRTIVRILLGVTSQPVLSAAAAGGSPVFCVDCIHAVDMKRKEPLDRSVIADEVVAHGGAPGVPMTCEANRREVGRGPEITIPFPFLNDFRNNEALSRDTPKGFARDARPRTLD
jgi:hypothetical protein